MTSRFQTRRKQPTEEWSSLLPGIIDLLVDVLKKTRRWRRDGPALRQLNKYWCVQLNQHIVHVRPHKSRAVVERDAASLLKFPNLARMDVTPFVGRDYWERTRSRCSGVVRVLSRLPKIAHLQMNADVLSKLTEEDLNRVGTVTSVHIGDGVFRGESLLKLSSLPLKELTLNGTVRNLGLFLKEMPFLKRLDAWISEPKCSDDVALLQSLNEVALRVHGSVNPFIAHVTALVSLDITCCGLGSLEPLTYLPKLRNLALTIGRRDVLISVSFRKVLAGLMSLDLRSQKFGMELPLDFMNDAGSLHHLSLFQFLIMGECLLTECSQNIKSLTLGRCFLMDSYACLESWSSLTALCLNNNFTRRGGGVLFNDLISVSALFDLKFLEIHFDKEFQLDGEILEQICRLPRLETLKLPGGLKEGLSNKRSFAYNKFEALGTLPELSELMISGPADWVLLERVLSMDFLLRLEKLTIQPQIKVHDLSWLVNRARVLREKAPHLKLEIEST